MSFVLVSGAYGGMGRATVKQLVAEGYTVFALDKRVEEATPGVIPIEVDVTKEESIQHAAEQVKQVTGSLFAILHFAGIYMLDSLVEIPSEEYDRIWQINVRGAYLIDRIFAPFLQKGSRIVITTSELAPLWPLPFTGLYGVTKGALEKYAYSLAMELQLLGISVSVLRAGAVKTPMLGVSTKALEDFCQKTKLYSCNAVRFRQIVDRVEAKSVAPEAIAKKQLAILHKKHPKFAYAINRNVGLLLLDRLPAGMRLWIIRKLLK